MTLPALPMLLGWASRQVGGAQKDGVNVLCCDFVSLSGFCSLVIGLNYRTPPGGLMPPPSDLTVTA